MSPRTEWATGSARYGLERKVALHTLVTAVECRLEGLDTRYLTLLDTGAHWSIIGGELARAIVARTGTAGLPMSLSTRLDSMLGTIERVRVTLLPLFIDEARKLERINAAFEQELLTVSSRISGLRARLKTISSSALRSRRAVAQILMSNVLALFGAPRGPGPGGGQSAEVRRRGASVRGVANILEKLLADPELAKALALYEYTAAHVAHLRAPADEVEALAKRGTELTPPQETDQRALDRQDGLVLAIMRAIWVPLRAAKNDGAAVSLPAVGALERLFIRSSSDAGDDGEAVVPSEDIVADEDAAEGDVAPPVAQSSRFRCQGTARRARGSR